MSEIKKYLVKGSYSFTEDGALRGRSFEIFVDSKNPGQILTTAKALFEDQERMVDFFVDSLREVLPIEPNLHSRIERLEKLHPSVSEFVR